MSGVERFERSSDSKPYRVRKRPSYLSPAASRCHIGNGHSAYTAPDYRPVYDTGRGAPRIPPANFARCTVANPQRSARATAGSASTATGCHGRSARPAHNTRQPRQPSRPYHYR